MTKMRRGLIAVLSAALLLLALGDAAWAQGVTRLCVQSISGQGAASCQDVAPTFGLPVSGNAYPAQSTAITGNATGSTSAVVGTLAAAAGKTTYICGFDVSAIGGTAAVGPVTVAGLVGSSMVYQLSSLAAGITLSRTFTPCIPGSAVNTAITVTTTADGSASAVDVNAWGYQQ